MKTNINIGASIRKGLQKKNWTQLDFARKIGKSQSTISEWISNKKHPLSEELISIAIELDIVPDLFPGYMKLAPLETEKEGISVDKDKEIEKLWQAIYSIENKQVEMANIFAERNKAVTENELELQEQKK